MPFWRKKKHHFGFSVYINPLELLILKTTGVLSIDDNLQKSIWLSLFWRPCSLPLSVNHLLGIYTMVMQGITECISHILRVANWGTVVLSALLNGSQELYGRSRSQTHLSWILVQYHPSSSYNSYIQTLFFLLPWPLVNIARLDKMPLSFPGNRLP